ncbi:DUF6795 domain-containing protein [Pseudomonadota bacterium]
MSFGFKICLASNSSGVVTDGGEAVKGATVKRKVVRDDKEYLDEVVTGENGEFAFPAIYERSLLKHAPIQPTVSQEVSIYYKEETHLAWELVKMDWDYLSEINSGKTIRNNTAQSFKVSCELSDKEHSRYAPNTLRSIHGKCLLESESRPQEEQE